MLTSQLVNIIYVLDQCFVIIFLEFYNDTTIVRPTRVYIAGCRSLLNSEIIEISAGCSNFRNKHSMFYVD